jgi:hypothetical protein
MSMKLRNVLAVALAFSAVGIVGSQSAHAQRPGTTDIARLAARQAFLDQLFSRNQTGSPALISLPPNLVRGFLLNQRYLIQTPGNRYSPSNLFFWQNFTLEFYRNRAAANGTGVAGGIAFAPAGAGTAFAPVSRINIFSIYRLFNPLGPLF